MLICLYIQRPTSGRRSTVNTENKKTEDLEKEPTGRKKFREIVDIDLEQSLNSINKFEHSHLGRITSNLDLEKGGRLINTCNRPFDTDKRVLGEQYFPAAGYRSDQ